MSQAPARVPVPREIWVLVVAAFVIALGFGIIAPILPQFAASFDVGFLDNELELLGREHLRGLCAGVIDTLKLAKEQNPGKKASLDALCDRYEINNAHRELHGALLDAELLADVYLAMTRGQESLIMSLDEEFSAQENDAKGVARVRMPVKVLRSTDAEREAHERVLADIVKANKGTCLWLASAEAIVS